MSLENVLGATVDGECEPVLQPGIEVRRSGDEDADAWLDLVTVGFARPERHGAPTETSAGPAPGRERAVAGVPVAAVAALADHRRRKMSYSAVGSAGEVGEGSGGAAELAGEPDAGGDGEEFGGVRL